MADRTRIPPAFNCVCNSTFGCELCQPPRRSAAITLTELPAVDRERDTLRPEAPIEREDWHDHLTDWRHLTRDKRAALRSIAKALRATDDANARYLAELVGRLVK